MIREELKAAENVHNLLLCNNIPLFHQPAEFKACLPLLATMLSFFLSFLSETGVAGHES